MALSNKQVELLKEIQNRLQRGDMVKIARNLGFTREHVSRSLSIRNDFFNDSIVAAAMEVITTREQTADKNLHLLNTAMALV